MNKMSLVIENG